MAEILSTTRGADISFSSLQDVNDIVSDELEDIAGKGGTKLYLSHTRPVLTPRARPCPLPATRRPHSYCVCARGCVCNYATGTNDSFVLNVNKFDAATLMKASKAENEAALAAGIDLLMVQGDGGLWEQARVTQHADDCVK